MNRSLLIFAVQGLLCAQTAIGPPRVGVLDYYGLRKLTPERIQRVLATREGDPFPPSKGEVEERLEKIPGVLRSHLEAVCCDEGKAILFVGIEEKGAPRFDLHSPPAGEARLPADTVEAYGKFMTTFEAAVRAGNTADDVRSGHSLMADPDTREQQQAFIAIAARDMALLKDVLRTSADEEHRAIAAFILGYAPRKSDVVNDLQAAIQDPAEAVRNNTLRALGAIAILAALHPEQEIKISPTWFVEMLNSIVWTDRNKAVMALLNLTDSRPETTLSLIRDRALPSLVEMARWKSLSHALGPFMLLGRIAGMTDQQIQDSWTKGEREKVISAASSLSNKRSAPPDRR